MLTSKHFEMAADIIATIAGPDQRGITARQFSDWFEIENPRFDRAQFLDACNATLDTRRVRS